MSSLIRQTLQQARKLLQAEAGKPMIQLLRPFQEQVDRYPEIIKLLGLAYAFECRYLEARPLLEQALRQAPQDPHLLGALGKTLVELDEPDAAIAYMKQALTKGASPYYYHRELAWLLDALGRLDEAKVHSEQLLNLNPNSPEALFYASFRQRFDAQNPWIDRLHQLTKPENQPQNINQQAMVYFTLGKVYQDLQDPERAFNYYQQGNQLLFPERNNNSNLPNLYRQSRTRYTPEFSYQLKQPRETPANPEIFICGLSRSGKSLVESLLACHPQVTADGEHRGFVYAVRKHFLNKPNTPPTPQVLEDYLAARHDGSDCWRTTTTPDNLKSLGVLGEWFPRTPIIFVTRGLDDLGLANYFKYYGRSNKHTFDLKTCGYYIRYYEALMDLWIEVLPNPCLKIRYEDLVQHPAAISKKLYEFIGLDWQADYFKVLQEQREHSEHLAAHQSLDTPSAIRSDFVGWSATYEQHLAPLREGYQQATQEIEQFQQGKSLPAPRVQVMKKTSVTAVQSLIKQALATHSVQRAANVTKRLVQANPQEPRFLRLQGIAASLAGYHEAALASFKQALALKPKDFGLQVNLLRAELRAGQPEAASKRLKKLTTSFPIQTLLPRLQLEVFLAQPSRNHNKLQQQLQNCQQLLEAEPDDPELINAQARLLALLGEAEQAQALHQQAYAQAEARQAADPATTQAPLKTQILLDQARSLYHHQPTAVDAACNLLAQALQIRPYSLATRAAWDQLQSWLPECQKPEWQQLASLHQAMNSAWSHYQADELEVPFGDFGLPYQGLESLHLAGGRPALSRLATYGLSDFLPEQARALDIGCNHGYLLLGLADQLSEGWGFDISQTCIQVGQVVAEHLGHSHIHLRHQTFEDFQKEQPVPFDLIIACAVHHWIGAQPKAFGELLLGLSNPGGLVLLESQGLRQLEVTEEGFADKAADIASAGFKVLRKGSLCDDGVNYREFWILQRPHTESGVTA